MQFNLITDLDDGNATLSERALHYGDGLFETMLLQNGQVMYWPQHYQRLHCSAAKLKINCPPRDWFEQHLQSYVSLNQPLVIKVMLTRGSGGRGMSLPDDLRPNVYLMHYPCHNTLINQTISAIISDITLPKDRHLAGIKHLNRLHYVLAAEALKHRPEYNEAILCDEDGILVESIVHNVFFVHQDIICSPDLSVAGVDGILRQQILETLAQQGKKVNIGSYTKNDIFNASECFLCNSVQGIRPIVRLEQVEYAIGPITQQLQQKFHGSKAN